MNMAIKKATSKIKRIFISSVFLLVLLLVATPGWATLSQISVVLSLDNNGDGVAGIGDTITISCRSTIAGGDEPTFTANSLGITNMPIANIGGTLHSTVITVSPGSHEGNVTFSLADDNDSKTVTPSFSFDNRRPNSLYGPTDNSSPTGLGGIFKSGDKLKLELNISNPDGDVVTANLSNIGLSSAYRFQSANPHTLEVTIPTNREGNNMTIPVRAIDNAGNDKIWNDISISYDTIAPVIREVLITNTTGGDKTHIQAGDAIRIQAVISNYDYDTVIASNTRLFPSPETLTLQPGSTAGGDAIFEKIVYVTEAFEIQNTFIYFDITATDDAGNISTKVSNSLRIDTIPPEIADLNVKVIRGTTDITGDIAIISDIIEISGNMATLMPDVILTANLSDIGGSANHNIPFVGGSTAPNVTTTSFRTTFAIPKGVSENSITREFVITAKDLAGNLITKAAIPPVFVDNLPPTISGGNVANVSRPGLIARHGDQIAISAAVGSLDGGSVYVDLRDLGGDVQSPLSIYGTSYRIDHVISDSTVGGRTDQHKTFVVYAVDDAGNIVNTVTNSLSIDNEPPKIEVATYSVSPVLSPLTHPYVKVGDRITFKVKLASSTSAPYDGQTVTINLSGMGMSNAYEMEYDADGYYVTTGIVVPAGTLDGMHGFSATATDNAGNAVSRTIQVPIDNSPPDVGPMGVNFLTDLSKTGAVNIGDILEFIIPVNDQDGGSCTLDLSAVGGSSVTQLTNYDPTLRRYYHVHTCSSQTVTIENPSYVFRAIVYDKAFNTMNSLSSTFEVDCRPPVVTSFSTQVQELKGKAGIVNTGDKIKFTAMVDLSALDGGVPTVNLSAVGGSSNQHLYDDGANGDGAANDGEFAYTYTVLEGSTNGENVNFVLNISDNAGNRVSVADRNPDTSLKTYLVDNQSISIVSVTNTQKQDTNGNSIVDLDGTYTTTATYATDSLVLRVVLSDSNGGKPASVTVDLTKLGYPDVASDVPQVFNKPTEYEVEIQPRRGNTNSEDVKLVVRVTDENGNETVVEANTAIKVDNQPPTIEVYPISFVVDNGRPGEANLGDVIQIKVKMTNHDGILPMLDFVNLYNNNGLTPPNPVLFPPNAYGGNEYTYQWTVPEGLGTKEGLTIVALDASGNMVYKFTDEIRFLSKTPRISGYPASRLTLFENVATENNIANPGERIVVTCAVESLYNINNIPPANVLVDIRAITNNTGDDDPGFEDGDANTYWVALTSPINNVAPFVYTGDFTVAASDKGIDADTVNFNIKVPHPDTTAITMATAQITSNPDVPFGIDTRVPRIKPGTTPTLVIAQNNGDNPSTFTANISDVMRVQANIDRLTDPGSVTAIIHYDYLPSTRLEVFRVPMSQVLGSDLWEGTFVVATGTRDNFEELGPDEWRIIDGPIVKFDIYMSDDADNLATSSLITPNPNIRIDNNPPQIKRTAPSVNRIQLVDKNLDGSWIANVGNGLASDSISAWIELASGDLNSRAYVDFSLIGGTSTYMLEQVSADRFATKDVVFPANYAHFPLPNGFYDLATHTFKIYVVDAAGNRDYIEDEFNQLAVDSKRPEMLSADYDGNILVLNFSEALRPDTFNLNNIRIGHKPDHKDIRLDQSSVVQLDTAKNDILLFPTAVTSGKMIQLGSYTKSLIADWGKDKTLYISLASNDSDDGADYDPLTGILGLDEAGNWVQPIPRFTMKTVFVTHDYARPQLVSGSYNANTTLLEREYLYLTFNKAIDPNTLLTNKTLKNLAIYLNRASTAYTNWKEIYRFAEMANDSFTVTDMIGDRILKIRLSPEAQDWIALNYGRLGTRFHLAISGSEYEPPSAYPPEADLPFIRDFNGNAVIPVLPANAVESNLTPLNSTFQVGEVKLDISSTTPMVTVNIPNNRRVRLFDDIYNETSLTISRTMPVDLSKVYICEKYETSTGRSLSLGSRTNLTNPMVDWQNFAAINDFASTTVNIPLTAEALKTMLSWGTSKFYFAFSAGAFKDLWGNTSEMSPSTSGVGKEVTPVIPAITNPPTISTLAIRPVVNYNNVNLFKSQPADGLIYEVAFDTAVLSANVTIPIDRTKTPTLTLKRQDVAGSEIHKTRFIAWADHVQNGVTKTVAQFANMEMTTSGNDQQTPAIAELGGVADIFGKPLVNTTASYAYDLNSKDTSGSVTDGFRVASYPISFDNYAPRALSATSTSPIGVTSAGNLKVTVVFNEELDTNVPPTLRMMQGTFNVMNFKFDSMSGNVATYSNSAAFDANIAQGECYYSVSGGFDKVGNPGNTVNFTLTPVFVYSRGPAIKAFNVQTRQSTTEKPGYEFSTNAPFSPKVLPGIATISVEFDTLPRDNGGFVRIYATNQTEPVASLTASPSGSSTVWEATWDGKNTSTGQLIDNAEVTYELRFYDLSGNEGNRRGSITLDSLVPRVAYWEFPNLKMSGDKAYFSPVAQSAAKMNVYTTVGQGMKMRLIQPGNSTDTYLMTSSSGSGYTINFDGKSADNPARTLEGEFEVSLVDLAGNVGIPVAAGSKATATLVIDRMAPEINAISMYKVDSNGNKITPAVAVERFNSRIHQLMIEVNEAYTTSPMASGTGLIRIMSGSTLLKEIVFKQSVVTDPLYVVWDGTNSSGQLLADGKYSVRVADLAGNVAVKSAEIEVISSVFKITSVAQTAPDSLRMVFSHGISTDNTLNPSPFKISPVEPAGLSIEGALINALDNKVITASFSQTLDHGKVYQIAVDAETLLSEDGVYLAAGNNTMNFTADSKGPAFVNITYDGITSQKMLNIVFDEVVEETSANTKTNYKLMTGTTNLQISSVARRADQKSVTLTALDNIVEGQFYTLEVKGVKDLIGNAASFTTDPFEGRDVTPPTLTVTAFSNPANEFDMVVIVKANEDIAGQPTATITQSGGSAVSLLLNPGSDLRTFIGGTHLDRNFPGVATIRVTAKDEADNTGTANISFSTAFVNAAMRAAVKSADSLVEAVFEPGTLNKNSLVLIIPEELSKTASGSARASIMPSALIDMNSAQLNSVRGSVVANSIDLAAEELEPLGQAYSLIIPAGRLKGSVAMSMKFEAAQLPTATSLYFNNGTGWKQTGHVFENNMVKFAASAAGTFAMMRDIRAPRATLVNDLTSAPVRESRPVFTWNIEEYASGIDVETAFATLNGRKYPIMLDSTGQVARFVPSEDLVSGSHNISLRVSDKAGNETVLPALRFQALPALKIHEVVQFPNPARNRVNLRISTNRNDVDADEIRVRIYDSAGHMVAATNDLVFRQSSNGGRVAQDVVWDLRNKAGKNVANGVYFAKIELKDPDNREKKTRYTHKIAVLR